MILREEDEGGRAMVMRDDERVRKLNRDQVIDINRLSNIENRVYEREREAYIQYVRCF